jgi:beta-N-acetylhexosaminidase
MVITLIFGVAIGYSIGHSVGKSAQAPAVDPPMEMAEATHTAESADPDPAPDAETPAADPAENQDATGDDGEEPAAAVSDDGEADSPPEPTVVDASPPAPAVEPDPPAVEPDPPAVEPDPPAEEASPTESWPGRHVFMTVEGTSLNRETRALLEEIKPGGVVLTAQNIGNREETLSLVRAIKEAAGFGSAIHDLPLIAIDQEGGPINRLNLSDAPSAKDLGDSRDTAAARNAGRDYATAMSARDVGVMLAPVMDVYEQGSASDVKRSFGDDVALVTAMGLAFADGAMRGGVIPVVKHFPGQGASQQSDAGELPVLDRDVPALANLMFPFSESVSRGIPGIMVGHVVVPALERGATPPPASLSPQLIGVILRQRWGYEGVILVDDLAGAAITEDRSPGETAVAALRAGADAFLFLDGQAESVRALCQTIQEAQDEDEALVASLAESRVRLNGWQAWLRQPKTMAGPLPRVPERLMTANATPKPVAVPDPEPEVEAPPEPVVPEGEPTIHVIRRGETLTQIARQHKVTTRQLMDWNGLEDAGIKYGKKLNVYKGDPPTPKADDAADDNEDSGDAPPPAGDAADTQPEAGAASPVPAPQPPGTRKSIHVVRPGELLGALAERFSVSLEDIMSWSGIDDPVIRVGQQLIIYVPDDTQED